MRCNRTVRLWDDATHSVKNVPKKNPVSAYETVKDRLFRGGGDGGSEAPSEGSEIGGVWVATEDVRGCGAGPDTYGVGTAKEKACLTGEEGSLKY